MFLIGRSIVDNVHLLRNKFDFTEQKRLNALMLILIRLKPLIVSQ